MSQSHKRGQKEAEKWHEGSDGGFRLKLSQRQQVLYLFDIVASLCAGFNEHDIQFLSSLLALLRGDLSAQVEAEVGGGGREGGLMDEQTDMEKKAQRRAETGEKQRV